MKFVRYLAIIVLIAQGQSIMAMKALEEKQNQIRSKMIQASGGSTPPARLAKQKQSLPPLPPVYLNPPQTGDFTMPPPPPPPTSDLPPYPTQPLPPLPIYEETTGEPLNMPLPPPPPLASYEETTGGNVVLPPPPSNLQPSGKPTPPSKSAKPKSPTSGQPTPPPPPPPPPLYEQTPPVTQQGTKTTGSRSSLFEQIKKTGEQNKPKPTTEEIEKKLAAAKAEKAKELAVATKEKEKKAGNIGVILESALAGKGTATSAPQGPAQELRQRFDAAKKTKNIKEIATIKTDVETKRTEAMDFDEPTKDYDDLLKEIKEYLETIKK